MAARKGRGDCSAREVREKRDRINTLESQKAEFLTKLREVRKEKGLIIEEKKKLDLDLAQTNRERDKKSDICNASRGNLMYQNEQSLLNAKHRLEHDLQVTNHNNLEEKRIVAEINKLNRNLQSLHKYREAKESLDQEYARYKQIKQALFEKSEMIRKARAEEAKVKEELDKIGPELGALKAQRRRDVASMAGQSQPGSQQGACKLEFPPLSSPPLSPNSQWQSSGSLASPTSDDTPDSAGEAPAEAVTVAVTSPSEVETPLASPRLCETSFSGTSESPTKSGADVLALLAPASPRMDTAPSGPLAPRIEMREESVARKVDTCDSLLAFFRRYPVPQNAQGTSGGVESNTAGKRGRRPSRYRGKLTLEMSVFNQLASLGVMMPSCVDHIPGIILEIEEVRLKLVTGVAAFCTGEKGAQILQRMNSNSTAGDSAFSELPNDASRPDSPFNSPVNESTRSSGTLRPADSIALKGLWSDGYTDEEASPEGVVLQGDDGSLPGDEVNNDAKTPTGDCESGERSSGTLSVPTDAHLPEQ